MISILLTTVFLMQLNLILDFHVRLNTSRTFGAIDKRLEAAERMFSITDDEEDMGEYVHA